MIGDLSGGIESRREELVFPDPSRCYPKNADDRATLLTGKMPIRGFNAKVCRVFFQFLLSIQRKEQLSSVFLLHLFVG